MFIPNPHANQPGQYPQSAPQNYGPAPTPAAPQSKRFGFMNVDPNYYSKGVQPTPVVKVLSPFGIEYVFMAIALLASAASIVGVLVSMIYGAFSISMLGFPLAVLLVSLPILYLLFMRLKKLELLHPELKFDASKRRSTQFIQIVTYLVAFITLIGMIFDIIAMIGGNGGSAGTFFKGFFSSLTVLVVSGGILAYFWLEEHKG